MDWLCPMRELLKALAVRVADSRRPTGKHEMQISVSCSRYSIITVCEKSVRRRTKTASTLKYYREFQASRDLLLVEEDRRDPPICRLQRAELYRIHRGLRHIK